MQIRAKIEVEFLVGTSLREAIEAAAYKAKEWGVCYVCFKFNGVRFSIGQHANLTTDMDLAWKAIETGADHEVLNGRQRNG